MSISCRQDDWVEWLTMAKFVYNNRQHSSTGKSLSLTNLRRHPNISGEGQGSSERVPEANEFIQGIRKARKEIEEALRRTNKVMKRRADKKRGEAVKYGRRPGMG